MRGAGGWSPDLALHRSLIDGAIRAAVGETFAQRRLQSGPPGLDPWWEPDLGRLGARVPTANEPCDRVPTSRLSIDPACDCPAKASAIRTAICHNNEPCERRNAASWACACTFQYKIVREGGFCAMYYRCADMAPESDSSCQRGCTPWTSDENWSEAPFYVGAICPEATTVGSYEIPTPATDDWSKPKAEGPIADSLETSDAADCLRVVNAGNSCRSTESQLRDCQQAPNLRSRSAPRPTEGSATGVNAPRVEFETNWSCHGLTEAQARNAIRYAALLLGENAQLVKWAVCEAMVPYPVNPAGALNTSLGLSDIDLKFVPEPCRIGVYREFAAEARDNINALLDGLSGVTARVVRRVPGDRDPAGCDQGLTKIYAEALTYATIQQEGGARATGGTFVVAAWKCSKLFDAAQRWPQSSGGSASSVGRAFIAAHIRLAALIVHELFHLVDPLRCWKDGGNLRACLPQYRCQALLHCALGSVYGVGPVSQDPDCAATDHE